MHPAKRLQRPALRKRWGLFFNVRGVMTSIGIDLSLKDASCEQKATAEIYMECASTFRIHSFIPSFLHSFIPSFLPSFLHSFIPSFLPSFFHSFIPSFLHSFIQSFIHSVRQAVRQSGSQAVSQSVFHAFSH